MKLSLQTKNKVDSLLVDIDDYAGVKDLLMSIVQEHSDEIRRLEDKANDYENKAKVYKEAMEEALEDKKAYRLFFTRGNY